jgi:hypothetical protein
MIDDSGSCESMVFARISKRLPVRVVDLPGRAKKS